MGILSDVVKRGLVGRPLSSESAGEQLLPKKLALPIFAADALSSVAYATQEILLVLSIGGTAFLYLTPYVAAAVVLLLAIVVASYRQLVHAYPSGGGDYEVSFKNLGPLSGVTVASALLVDYVMTVAVSVSAGIDNVISASPGLAHHRVPLALGCVVLLTAANLRGVRESGKAFATPTYVFVTLILLLLGTAVYRTIAGHHLVAESARYAVHAEKSPSQLTGLALVFLALRAFASGCTALTGVEAIANGVQSFKKPKSKNAAATLLLMGGLAMTMFIGITALALKTHVHLAEKTCDLVGYANCSTAPQKTVIAQVSAAVFGSGSLLFYFLQAATAAILILAANTAFNGFPSLGSILARDSFLPRQLHSRGDRLVFSNGIILLALVAGGIIFAFDANVTHLIQLYILGVFTSFTCGQTGMVRHWNRLLTVETDQSVRRRIMRSRAINATGASATGLVLVIVTITKFSHGAYLVIIAMPILILIMKSINGHYSSVRTELAAGDEVIGQPSRIHAIVLVSKVHSPTLRALAYAKATRPSSLVALTVSVEPDELSALEEEWARRGIDIPLIALNSPYREITKPILGYVNRIRRESPRDVVCVYIPEYVVGHWWEQLLHNQSALRLKARLLFEPGIMMTSVPYQLRSSEKFKEEVEAIVGDAGRSDD